MINLRTVLQWRDASKPSLSFKLWTGWRRGGWCDLMLIKPIIKYRHHITHSTAASSTDQMLVGVVGCQYGAEDWLEGPLLPYNEMFDLVALNHLLADSFVLARPP